jgi:hypothetical protein
MIKQACNQVNINLNLSSNCASQIKIHLVDQDELDELNSELKYLIHPNTGRIKLDSILLKIVGGINSKFDDCFAKQETLASMLEKFGYYKNVSTGHVKKRLRAMRARGWISVERFDGRKRATNVTKLTHFGKGLYWLHIKKNISSTQVKLSTKSVDNYLVKAPTTEKMTPQNVLNLSVKIKNDPSNIHIPYSDKNIHDLSMDMDLGIPARGEQQDHEWVSPNNISHIQEIEITKVVKMKDINEDLLPAKIISDRFSGSGTHFSVANGHLQLIGSDSKRKLAFANALVEGCEGLNVSELHMIDFAVLAKDALQACPPSSIQCIGKIDSYEKLRKAGINIPDPKVEKIEDDPLPYSVKQQLSKFFFYQERDHVNHALKEIRKNHKESEGNLINLVESVHNSQGWLKKEKNIKDVDLGMLVRSMYKKMKEKYKW